MFELLTRNGKAHQVLVVTPDIDVYPLRKHFSSGFVLQFKEKNFFGVIVTILVVFFYGFVILIVVFVWLLLFRLFLILFFLFRRMFVS